MKQEQRETLQFDAPKQRTSSLGGEPERRHREIKGQRYLVPLEFLRQREHMTCPTCEHELLYLDELGVWLDLATREGTTAQDHRDTCKGAALTKPVPAKTIDPMPTSKPVPEPSQPRSPRNLSNESIVLALTAKSFHDVEKLCDEIRSRSAFVAEFMAKRLMPKPAAAREVAPAQLPPESNEPENPL